MSDFRHQLKKQSKKLLKSFSAEPVFSMKHPGDYHRNNRSKEEWCRFVERNANVDVRADLTFKQSIEMALDPLLRERLEFDEEYSALPFPEPVLETNQVKRWVRITEDAALTNISQFMNRLNYAAYKSAYRRYGKRLEIISGIEGGERFYRDNKVSIGEKEKHLHAHLLIQQPAHINFERFKGMILYNWWLTDWGDFQSNVERIKSIRGSAKYQVKSSMDSLDLKNTFINAGL